MKSWILDAVSACLLSIAVTPAGASYIYTYTGNSFETFSEPTTYDASMSVTATLEFTVPLAPNLSYVTLSPDPWTPTNFDTSVSPDSWTITDGVNILTQTTATGARFDFSTDAFGNITEWDVVAVKDWGVVTTEMRIIRTWNVYDRDVSNVDQGVILESPDGSRCESECTADLAQNEWASGTWSVSEVPLPTAVWLFGSGLLGLIGISRRKKAT